jgi:hypothetical protein
VSALSGASSISKAEGLDKSRALQRVLYRSAKQDPSRRFHALYDKLARSDILARAWGEPPRRNRPLSDCACLAVNDVGKRCAGEPHAPFDRGPLAKRQPRRAGIGTLRETGGVEPGRLPFAD